VFLEPSSSPLRARRGRRGFTLIELVVVVVIIGICAAMATPSVISQMRERRARDLAQRVAVLYSSARMRAMGRGAAVVVRYRAADGTFRVLQSIEGEALADLRGQKDCRRQPGLGCASNDWSEDDGALYSEVERLTIDTESYAFRAKDRGGSEASKMDICFSALGRSFISLSGESSIRTPMVSPTSFELRRAADGDAQAAEERGSVGNIVDGKSWRTVVILPNGTARLSL
jgi:type IV fimbrial biogenesis protein FimT